MRKGDSNYYRKKYRTKLTRHPNWDYGQNGVYFVTICTKDGIHWFGKVEATGDFKRQNSQTNSLSSEHLFKNPKAEDIGVETQDLASLPDPSLIQIPLLYAFNRRNCSAKIKFSTIGDIANDCWLAIPEHFPFVKLGLHVVMPNHVHGILFIDKKQNFNSETASKEAGFATSSFGPQSRNLASPPNCFFPTLS